MLKQKIKIIEPRVMIFRHLSVSLFFFILKFYKLSLRFMSYYTKNKQNKQEIKKAVLFRTAFPSNCLQLTLTRS